MTIAPSVAVVVPAWNAEATLDTCLAALIGSGFAPREVIVSDDGSTDATPAIAARHGVRLIPSGNQHGAAAARNAGAAAAQAHPGAEILVFVDADVAVHPGLHARVLAFFASHPDHAGIIGSYDDAPPAPGALSRIRNLLHHHVHQNVGGGAGADVPSFWTGCGAIRAADFEAAGRFECGHALEDVALGLALARLGRRIRLDPALQCTHLKRWTLRSMLRADLLYRALPWSRMILDAANRDVDMTLNANAHGKLSVLLTGGLMAGLFGALALPVVGGGLAAACLVLLAIHNRGFLALVAKRLGPVATVQALAVLVVHFLCAGAGFAIALAERLVAALMAALPKAGARP